MEGRWWLHDFWKAFRSIGYRGVEDDLIHKWQRRDVVILQSGLATKGGCRTCQQLISTPTPLTILLQPFVSSESYLVRGWRLQVGVGAVAVTGPVRLGFVEQRHVVRSWGLEAVAHLRPNSLLSVSLAFSRRRFSYVTKRISHRPPFPRFVFIWVTAAWFQRERMTSVLLSQTMGGLPRAQQHILRASR